MDADATEDEVIALLADPASHGSEVTTVERVDTHAAIVFLAGDEALKIKRPVALGYLDFTDPAERRRVCEREVALNRRTAPDLYLGVTAIVRRPDGCLAIGGEGEPVEWAVRMRRFAADALADTLARRGELALDVAEAIARTVAALHRETAPATDTAAVDRLRTVITTIDAALARTPDVVSSDAREDLVAALRDAYAEVAPILRLRAERGWIRRCHGDLHLRNIVVESGTPLLFDALEFDESLATIDVLYDLAFLLMDLWHRGLRRQANAVLNVYLTEPGGEAHLGDLRVLPLFLALRAGVRAMVAVDARTTSGAASDVEIRAYTDLARTLLAASTPRLVAIGGLSGTGKSTLGAALAPDVGRPPGAVHLRSDVIRKQLAGVAPLDRLPASAYAAQRSHPVYDELCARAAAALAAGHSVVVDAVFASPAERDAITAVATRADVAFHGIWLHAPQNVLETRVGARKHDASDADVAVVRAQQGYDVGAIHWRVIDASGTPDDVRTAAVHVLTSVVIAKFVSF